MYAIHLARRLAMFFLVIVTAATINFFVPRLSDKNPVLEKITEMSISSAPGSINMQNLLEVFNERFGLDRPLWEQYLAYLGDMLTLDLNYSITSYPNRVADMIAEALPWTIGLMLTSTLIAFLIGTVLGALTVWRKDARLLQFLVPVIMVLSAIPFYLIGLVLIYFLSYRAGWFPIGGGYSIIAFPGWNWEFMTDVMYHSILPATSIVVASIGIWSLSMRGMMVTVQGEDYMNFAEAKGLTSRRIFLRYGIRNAILPQITQLALFMGQIVTGAVLVEIVFGYPGMGSLLLQAVDYLDYYTIYGIVFVLILAVALSMLLLDLVYPLLDPRTKVARP
jgi:peptide/nickel transport system permease protein